MSNATDHSKLLYPIPHDLEYTTEVYRSYMAIPPQTQLDPVLIPLDPKRYPNAPMPSQVFAADDARGKRRALLPPKVHYGFVVNDDVINAYADQYNAKCYENLLDDDCIKYNRVVNDMRTTKNVLYYATKELGFPKGKLKLELRLPYKEDEPKIISLATNYTLHRMPTDEQLRKVQKFLKEHEPPKWYLDLSVCKWRLSSLYC